MPRREVQALEVVVRRLDLASVDDLVAEAEEHVLDLAADLRDQVQMPALSAAARQGDVVAVPRRGRRARASSAVPRSASALSIRSRSAFSVIPVSRSRTARSACFSSLLRPRKRTRASSSSSALRAAAIALRASLSSGFGVHRGREYQRPLRKNGVR